MGWIKKKLLKKEGRITEETVVTGEMKRKRQLKKEDRITEGTVVTGEMDRKKAA